MSAFKESDYESLGLKVGLEIHQQLNTKKKLHCYCDSKLKSTNDIKFEFMRYLHPKSNQNGMIDNAAIEQTKANRKYIYKAYDNNCLVELDEGDPFPINKEALDIALIIAKFLKITPGDIIYVMRKIIVDGSSTSGFQRTTLIGNSGIINTKSGNCKISSLCLEEDSCTNLETNENYLVYSLDRLGIPLIEVATEPDIKTPKQAYEVAKEIGMILRSTGKVKRGIGTIRQDVNISIKNGSRVEIKGVQNLDTIPKLIDMEIIRQLNLLKLKKLFSKNNVKVNSNIINCTSIFKNTKSKIISNSIHNDGVVLCIIVENAKTLIGYELQQGRRFGTELADKAKYLGLNGLFHTDELPNYGITIDEIISLYKHTNAKENDAIIIITGSYEKASKALKDIVTRIESVCLGVPNETRKALLNCSTSYLRQLPGPARMYPETDLEPTKINNEYFKKLKVPELISKKIQRYQDIYSISKELSETIIYSKYISTFEHLVKNIGTVWKNNIVTPTILANIFVNIFQDLKRENLEIVNIDNTFLFELLSALNNNLISKEAIKDILIHKCKDIKFTFDEIIDKYYTNLSEEEELLEKDIKLLIKEKINFIESNKERAVSPLMGIIMKKYRGRIDGKKINDLLKKQIKIIINGE